MQDLRFVGVHEDGLHLLLADGEGNRYRVPLDEPLRGAARRERPRQGHLPVETGSNLRPKDVQAMIRAGLTADEVAERAGWSVEKVHRYEGPILAEREYVASLARQVRLRPRGGAHGTAATLEARVGERLRSREIEPSAAVWDSSRASDGRWTVVVYFSAGGRQRQAGWDFDPLARTVSATDDEARWLSEDEDGQTPGPIPAPHLQSPPRPSAVYDVEAEGGVAARPKRRRAEPVDLMAAMRERSSQRGRRRRSKATEAPGLDRAPDEALPLEDLAMSTAEAGDPPAAHTHPADDPTAVRDDLRDDLRDDEPDMASEIFDEPLPLEDLPGAEPSAGQPAADASTHEMPVEAVDVGNSDLTEANDLHDEAPLGAEREDTEADAGSDAVTPRPDDAANHVGDTTPMPISPPTSPAHDVDEDVALDDEAEDRAEGADDETTAEEPTPRVPDAGDDQAPGDDQDLVAQDESAEGADIGVESSAASETAPVAPAEPDTSESESSEPKPTAARSKPASGRKTGRPSVPSWDDIMFGRKTD